MEHNSHQQSSFAYIISACRVNKYKLFMPVSYACRVITLFACALLLVCAFAKPSHADILHVSHSPPPNIDIEQGSSNIIGDILDLRSGNGIGIIINTLTVYELGSSGDCDVSLLKLVDDTNGNGSIDPGEPTLSSTTLAGGKGVFSSLSLPIPANSTKRIIIAYDISSTASMGAAIQVHIAPELDITVSHPGSTASFTGAQSFDDWDPLDDMDLRREGMVYPILSNNISTDSGHDGSGITEFSGYTGRISRITDKPDTLFINQDSIEENDLILGSTDYIVQVLNLSVDEDRADLQNISIRRTGTAVDSDTVPGGIKIWYDADNNGLLTKGDRQLSASATFVDGIAVFNNIKSVAVKAGSPQRLLITCSVSLEAVIDRTIGVSLESTRSIESRGQDIVSIASIPLTSPLHIISPQPPSAPTGLSVTAKEANSIYLNWSSNRASEHVTKYMIYRAEGDGPFNYIGETTNSDYTDIVPIPGFYLYRVSSANKSGASLKSAMEQAETIDINVTIPSTGDTATVESADGSIVMTIPSGYPDENFSISSAAKPPGLNIVSNYYYEFSSTVREPFDPPITIKIRCNTEVNDSVKIYHYNDRGEWVEVSEELSGKTPKGRYGYDGKYISYDRISEFSGYAAAEAISTGGYNDPLVNTDTPSGPHGQYTSASNKCKDCHAAHGALGSYRLTRADTRGNSCNFCHGIGGAATKIVILDAEGHGLSPDETMLPVTSPGDTDPVYTSSASLWGCLECHSVHNNQTVILTGYSSSKLLKSDPNPGKPYLFYTPVVGETTQTLSHWCSSCHNANFGPSWDIMNKLAPIGSGYGLVASHSSSGEGYITDAIGNVQVKLDDGDNNGPTCRQCHPSDGGSVSVTAKFPHTSGSTPSMLKAGTEPLSRDSACIDCHHTASLN